MFLFFFFFSGLSTFFTFLVNFPFLAAFVLFLCLLLSFFLSVLNLLLHSFLLSPFLQSPSDSLTSLCRRRSFSELSISSVAREIWKRQTIARARTTFIVDVLRGGRPQ